jgi:hypothetical protein
MTSLSIRGIRTSCQIVAASVLLAFFASPVGSETRRPGIIVELNPEKPLWLRVTLRSGADHTATIFRSELPWGYRYSMVFVAVRPNGQPIDMELPVEDPVAEKVSLAPGASLTGDVDLARIISDVNRVTKQSEVHLFWAYKSPQELHVPRWSGGWVLIPQQK